MQDFNAYRYTLNSFPTYFSAKLLFNCTCRHKMSILVWIAQMRDSLRRLLLVPLWYDTSSVSTHMPPFPFPWNA